MHEIAKHSIVQVHHDQYNELENICTKTDVDILFDKKC